MTADAAAIQRRFLAVDAATVSDVLDEFGIHDQGLSPAFKPLVGTRLVGRAYTIRGRSKPASSGGDPLKMEACEGISANEVAVWAGDGAGIAYFGELIARGLAERGCVGCLVQGAARDLAWLEEMGFPVFGTFRTPVQSIGRWSVEDWQVPIRLPGATAPLVDVHPGDIVVADVDGAIIVPAHHAEAVLARSEQLTGIEQLIRADLDSGLTLSKALEKYGHL